MTDYLDGFQYVNHALNFFPHAEGFVDVKGTNTEGYKYFYVYNYTDHLGNIRVSYGLDPDTRTVKTLEENHYYPFGLKHTNYNTYKRKFIKDDNPPINPTPGVLGLVGFSIRQIVSGDLIIYKYKYNGKEWQDELGLDMYSYGFRDYEASIGRWQVIDPLSEKYNSTSPYAFVENNPNFNKEIDGRYFEPGSKSDKQATRIENRAESRASKLDAKADRIEGKGESSGDLRARSQELKKTGQDVRDMRDDPKTEYKYANVDRMNPKPCTVGTGTNKKGDNVVTMYTDKTMGNKIHETRHGGDIARGDLSFNDTGGYGVSHEVSAYKAQYGYDGKIDYRSNLPVSDADALKAFQTGKDPTITTVNNFNQITPTAINSMTDPNYINIYPPVGISLTDWNKN